MMGTEVRRISLTALRRLDVSGRTIFSEETTGRPGKYRWVDIQTALGAAMNGRKVTLDRRTTSGNYIKGSLGESESQTPDFSMSLSKNLMQVSFFNDHANDLDVIAGFSQFFGKKPVVRYLNDGLRVYEWQRDPNAVEDQIGRIGDCGGREIERL